jgi:hypothetical protein
LLLLAPGQRARRLAASLSKNRQMLVHPVEVRASPTTLAEADQQIFLDAQSPFENGQACAIRRRRRLPIATWIMALDTSRRAS